MRRALICVLAVIAGCQDDDDTTLIPIADTAAADTAAGDDVADAATPAESVPTDPSLLFAYLQADSYDGFEQQTSVHAPIKSSPHGNAKTYLNKALADSLAAGNASHPAGAAAVKERFDADGTTLNGWAVWVKTAADSNGGANIFWYEIASTTSPANPLASGNGVQFCTTCHATDSKDFFHSDFPLE